VLSGGNFHAEPLALAADYLTIALTEVGNIAERRIAELIDPVMSNLPAFLSTNSGLNSGFMIAHCTAAALTAENRTLSMPASVETTPTSANQEDHVSMAPNAGLKLLKVIDNLQKIVWIEFLVAAQGMDLRKPLKGGRGTHLGWQKIRTMVTFLEDDRVMYPDLAKAEQFFDDQGFILKIANLANHNE
jgi:histidine ammonia-lyase